MRVAPSEWRVLLLSHRGEGSMCEMLQRAPASTQNLVFQSDAHPALLLLNVSEVTAFLPCKLLHPQSGGLLLHPLAKQLFGGGGEFRGGVDHPLSWRGEKKSLVLSKGCPGAGNRPDSLPPFMPVCASCEHNHAITHVMGLWGLWVCGVWPRTWGRA